MTAASLGEPSPLAAGEALVGIDVASAAAPVDAIVAGDRVQVIGVDKTGDANGGSAGRVLAVGRVVRVVASDSARARRRVCRWSYRGAAAAAVAAASLSQQAALVVIR